jgi:hypothetical protein
VHAVPERPFLLQIVTVFGGLVAGPFFGHHMGVWLTPGSEVVQTVSWFTFALVYVGGTMLWIGIGIVTVVGSGLWRLARGRRPGPEGLSPSERVVPAGYRSYAILGVVGGVLVGLLAGIVPSSPSRPGWWRGPCWAWCTAVRSPWRRTMAGCRFPSRSRTRGRSSPLDLSRHLTGSGG